MAKSNEKDLEAQKKGKKGEKNAKPNLFVRMGRKIKETFSELKRVTWPTFGKAVKATGVVILVVLIFTILFTGINVGFTELLKLLTGLGAN